MVIGDEDNVGRCEQGTENETQRHVMWWDDHRHTTQQQMNIVDKEKRVLWFLIFGTESDQSQTSRAVIAHSRLALYTCHE
jgi:hypothetical protein